jgi:LPS sulfotransferase NodH
MSSQLAWHPHFGAIGGRDMQAWLADYPPGPPPATSVFLATVERSGSEWLCQLLGATGQLGRPSEYLNTYWMRRFIPDYPEDVAAQVAIAHRVGTTPNQVFAMKMHPLHLDRLLQGSRVEVAFPNPVFVRLIRRDLLAQAISLYRARASNQYHAHVAAAFQIDYDGAMIRAMVLELVREGARWDFYFARNGLVPLTIAYEDLQAAPGRAVAEIGRRAGVAVIPDTIAPAQPLGIQRDEVSATWKRRFLAEHGNLNVLDPI